jgi:hypothetical protein
MTDQRWYMFQNMGPAPSPRYGHSLTAIKEKIFVFGGLLSPKAEDPNAVHVLDTCMCCFFCSLRTTLPYLFHVCLTLYYQLASNILQTQE